MKKNCRLIHSFVTYVETGYLNHGLSYGGICHIFSLVANRPIVSRWPTKYDWERKCGVFKSG